MSQLLNDPTTTLVLFFLCCVLAIATLLNSLKQGGSAFGIILAIIFAGIAAWLSPDVFGMMGSTPGMD